MKLVPVLRARPTRKPGAWAHLNVTEAQIANAFSPKSNAEMARLFDIELPKRASAKAWVKRKRATAGKLVLPDESVSTQLTNEGFGILPITSAHVERARELGGLLGYPFDLLLVAVADIERMSLLTKDRSLLSLGLKNVKEA